MPRYRIGRRRHLIFRGADLLGGRDPLLSIHTAPHTTLSPFPPPPHTLSRFLLTSYMQWQVMQLQRQSGTRSPSYFETATTCGPARLSIVSTKLVISSRSLSTVLSVSQDPSSEFEFESGAIESSLWGPVIGDSRHGALLA